MQNGKWVCVVKPNMCDGKRLLNGRLVDCPLKAYCERDAREGRRWQYEYPCTKRYGYILETTDPNHGRAHQKRGHVLRMVFSPEYVAQERARRRQWDAEHRDQKREYLRRWRAQKEPPKKIAVRATLPCGEDCENCPYDVCQYTDRAEDEIVAVRRDRREYCKLYRQQHREQCNARNLKWQREHKEQRREYLRRWYKQNRAAVLEYQRQYREKNLEKVREQKRRWAAKNRAEQKQRKETDCDADR